MGDPMGRARASEAVAPLLPPLNTPLLIEEIAKRSTDTIRLNNYIRSGHYSL